MPALAFIHIVAWNRKREKISHEVAGLFRSSFAGSHFPTRSILLGALFVTVYLASRLYAVTHIPIFIDEAIHVDWARSGARRL
jgi:hypothetical protein